jgi:hypothetical protein
LQIPRDVSKKALIDARASAAYADEDSFYPQIAQIIADFLVPDLRKSAQSADQLTAEFGSGAAT